MIPWLVNGEPFDTTYDQILLRHQWGFCYSIHNHKLDRHYLGRKAFHAMRKKKRHESNWRTYLGSCDALTQDLIKYGEEHFTREIVSFHQTPQLLNYSEVKLLFSNDVLFAKNGAGMPKYYNTAIVSGHWYPTSFTGAVDAKRPNSRPR